MSSETILEVDSDKIYSCCFATASQSRYSCSFKSQFNTSFNKKIRKDCYSTFLSNTFFITTNITTLSVTLSCLQLMPNIQDSFVMEYQGNYQPESETIQNVSSVCCQENDVSGNGGSFQHQSSQLMMHPLDDGSTNLFYTDSSAQGYVVGHVEQHEHRSYPEELIPIRSQEEQREERERLFREQQQFEAHIQSQLFQQHRDFTQHSLGNQYQPLGQQDPQDQHQSHM